MVIIGWLLVFFLYVYFSKPAARNAGRAVGVFKAGGVAQPPPSPAPASHALAPTNPLSDCYRMLDLQPDATLDEVRASYRELARVWHPDRFGADVKLREKANKKMGEINDAYEKIIAMTEQKP